MSRTWYGVLGPGWERLGTGSVAAAGRRGYIALLVARAGIEVGRRRVVGFANGLVVGREEGRSGSLGLGFGRVAMGWASLIVGRMGCWRLTASCSFAGLGAGVGCRGRDLPMGCHRWRFGWTWWWFEAVGYWWIWTLYFVMLEVNSMLRLRTEWSVGVDVLLPSNVFAWRCG